MKTGAVQLDTWLLLCFDGLILNMAFSALGYSWIRGERVGVWARTRGGNCAYSHVRLVQCTGIN